MIATQDPRHPINSCAEAVLEQLQSQSRGSGTEGTWIRAWVFERRRRAVVGVDNDPHHEPTSFLATASGDFLRMR